MNTIQIHIIVCVGIFYGMYDSAAQNIGGIINNYTEVKDIDQRCWRKIIVKSSSGFSVGDKVLIIQMQGVLMDTSNTSMYGTVTNYNNVGNSEFGRITGIAQDTINLYSSLTKSYSMEGKVQLIRVPEYENVTITRELSCKDWDGGTGGVLVLYARDTVTMKANINVGGKGYRGGLAVSSGTIPNYYISDYKVHESMPSYSAPRGEGICEQGDIPYINGRGSAANGGGGGGNHNTGGAGGANGGCGGNGSYGWVSTNYSGDNKTAQSLGGKEIDYTVHRTLLGGGGGAGHSNQNDLGHGGNGDGIVIVAASSLVNTASYSIIADGFSGKESVVDGSGGGGAGGTIYLDIAKNPTSTHILSVRGGKGGNNLYNGGDHPPGGGGGGGIVNFAGAQFPATIQLEGGKSGLSGTTRITYGAMDGCIGKIFESRKIEENMEEAATVSIIEDVTICKGMSVLLSGETNEAGQSYRWFPAEWLNNTEIVNPVATPDKTTKYCFNATKDYCTVQKCVTITVVDKIQLSILIQAPDSLRFTAGTVSPVTVRIPKGIDTIRWTTYYDDCCLLYKQVDAENSQLFVHEQGKGFITISAIMQKGSGDDVNISFLALLPQDGRVKEKVSINEITVSPTCINPFGSERDILYNPTCAWDIRGVFGSEKFDIVTSGEQAILWTGLGGKTTLSIYDMTGQEVWKAENTYPSSSEIEITLPELSGGVYILRASNYVWKKDVVLINE